MSKRKKNYICILEDINTMMWSIGSMTLEGKDWTISDGGRSHPVERLRNPETEFLVVFGKKFVSRAFSSFDKSMRDEISKHNEELSL